MPNNQADQKVGHYRAQYDNFEAEVVSDVRKVAFGEDIRQNGWLTVDEQDMFIDWMRLIPNHHLLDIACGSGQPTLRISEKTGCKITGIDVNDQAIAKANAFASNSGLADRAAFVQADASESLPFDPNQFDAIICIDAINHLPDRLRVLKDWWRVLRPGGTLLFTDPIVVTGTLTSTEIAIRASIGFFLFAPVLADEEFLNAAGFSLERQADRTRNMANSARRWLEARKQREGELRKLEGDETFDGQQAFFETAARLAEEHRLSRFAFLARKAG